MVSAASAAVAKDHNPILAKTAGDLKSRCEVVYGPKKVSFQGLASRLSVIWSAWEVACYVGWLFPPRHGPYSDISESAAGRGCFENYNISQFAPECGITSRSRRRHLGRGEAPRPPHGNKVHFLKWCASPSPRERRERAVVTAQRAMPPPGAQLNIKYIPSHTPHTNRTPPQHSTPAPRTCPARCLALLSTAPRATLPTTYPLPSTRGASRVRLVRVSARAAPREWPREWPRGCNRRAAGLPSACHEKATRRPRDQKATRR